MQDLELSLPNECGVMLLSGTALFPHSSMDLHIFEHRYRAMLSNALQESWMFAVGSLIEPEEEDLDSCVARIGTIGLISSSKTLPDGRSSLILTGIKPVRFEEWDQNSPYPKARITEVERIEVDESHQLTIKELILDATESQLDHVPTQVKASILKSLREMSDLTALIDNVSHNFLSDTDLRHELMIELDDSVRASKLLSVIAE